MKTSVRPNRRDKVTEKLNEIYGETKSRLSPSFQSMQTISLRKHFGPFTMKNPISRKIRKYFSGKPEALSVILYGSQASGITRPDSDVDVAVLLKSGRSSKSFEKKLEYQADLEDILGKDVDVVILNDADLFLAQQAITKGRTVFERDREKSNQLKWRLMRLWWDFIPTKRVYDEAALARLRRY